MPNAQSTRQELAYVVGDLHFSRRADAARLVRELFNNYFHLADYTDSQILEAASEDGNLHGVSLVRYPQEEYDADPRSAELQILAVARQSQKIAGVGSALLRAAEERAVQSGMREMWLWSDGDAVGFYEKQGYDHLRPNRQNPNMVPMAKRLA